MTRYELWTTDEHGALPNRRITRSADRGRLEDLIDRRVSKHADIAREEYEIKEFDE